MLFEYIKEHISPMSRKEAQIKVQVAAEKMLRIGMETDNVMALDKGSRRLFEVAGLDKPEDNSQDINKVSFLPPVVTTSASDVDPTKENVSDEQAKAIIAKYGAYVDEKRKDIEQRVDTMLAKRDVEEEKQDEQQVILPTFRVQETPKS